MGTLIQLAFQLVAVGFVSSQYSALLPTSVDEGCSSECIAGIPAGGVLFEENVKYGYDFSGKTTIIAPTDDSNGISEVSISGKANIIGTQQCGAIIYLKNVEITHGSKTYGDTKLEGYPILISYNNGRVSPKICASEKDSAASMNLKRAIVSAFQVSSVQDSEILETDVQGTCNTSYSLSSTDSYNVITKNKNLIKCSGYDKISMLAPNQNYEDSPFSEATQESKILLTQSMIRSVVTKETFLFQPLGPIGLITEIKTSMNLNLKKRSPIRAPSLNLERAQSIVFVKPASTIVSANEDQLVAATQLAMENLEPVVEMSGAKNFADLVELLKVASTDDILSAYQHIKSSSASDDNENVDVAETLFIDALMAANSGQSIEAVAELIKNNELSKSLTASWFINLAKANHPTKEAVVSASNLLNDKVIKESYMGIGVLLRQYLKDTHDYESAEVTNTLKNLAAPLQKTLDNSLSPEEEDIAIASLKGIESAKYINIDVEDLIVKTIMNKDASQRIRAAALAMARTYANNPKVENACESVFTDMSEDSELRILAFKAYAMYPSNKKAAIIKQILDDKNCQLQIKSYLLSYLNNIQMTVDENKLDQKQFYQGIKSVSSKKSLDDILRYSQNLEYYHNCPILRSGALLNRDFIYSYESFLPRSYSASLRTFIFGRPQNIFDFDIRVENIEPMLEKLFGPEGRFAQSNDHPISDIANYIIQAIKYAKQRGLNNIDSEKSPGSDGENDSVEDMNKMYVDIALKVLGNDFGWFAFQGIESQITYQHIIDAILKHFDGSAAAFTNKQDIELNIRKHLQVIDFEKKYAACSGLPISMKIQTTATIKLNMATNFDIQSYINQPENSNFALKLVPSGTLNLNTILTVNGHVVDVGHKVASTFHTSTGADLSVKTVSGRGFEIVYGLPLNVVDVLSSETGAFKIIQENGSPPSEEPIVTDVSRQSYSRTFDNLVDKTGLALKVEYDFPWDGNLQSILPFSGPSKLSIKFLKVDENLTKYVMKGIYDLKSPKLKYIKFVFVTPKADISRGVELFVAYESQPSKKFMAQFRTPSTSVVLQSTLINTDEQKTIEVQYTDGSEHDFSLGALCEKLDDDTMKYSPVFGATYAEYTTATKEKHPIVPIFDIEGSIIVKYTNCDDNSALSVRPRKITLQDIAFVTPKSKHSLQGSAMVEGNEINADASLTNGRIIITMKGYLSGHYPLYKASGAFDMIRSESDSVQERQLQVLADGESKTYQPASKFFEWLDRIKKLSMFTAQELHVQQPYTFITNNYVLWNDEKVDLNIDFLVENGELTINGNASTSDLLDLRSYATITVLPKTPSSGITILGHAEHSFISDPTDNGFVNVQYIQERDKTGSNLKINSECASIIGLFNLVTENHYVDEKLKFTLNYDVQNNAFLSIDLNAEPNEVNFDFSFDYPDYPYYKSYVIVRGWSENENTYLFDTKLLWPGTENLNYLNTDGKILLSEHQSQLRGNVNWPSANLENVQVLIDSIPNPEVEGGGIASIRCVSGKQVLFSEKLKYILSINDGEYVVSGESIQDGSKNYVPIHFAVQYKNYLDQTNQVCKEMTYKIVLELDDQTIVHQKSLQLTNNVIVYRQIHRINEDEQQISFDLEYDYTDSWNWYYNLKSKYVSPSVFHLLIHDDQNMLECDINVKVSDFSIDTGHTLKIFTSEALSQSYELKWLINDKQTALKYAHGQREIRGLMQYSLDSIDGGYKYFLSGNLYLDYNTNPSSKSSILVDTQYSIGDSLSTASNLRIYVPYFNDKEMSIKTDIEIFESFKNVFDVKLNLDIFPTTEQAIEILTSLKRDNQDNGVLYSVDLQALSEGMELDYLFKDSIFVSSDKWGKYIEASFIDSDNIERPMQLQFELVPSGINTKINIFDIAVINVASTFNVSDSLNAQSSITYNGIPYSVTLKFTSYPTLMLKVGWNDKSGSLEQLKVEGSITMDDSTGLSVTHIKKDGQEVTSVGSVKKSLERENWWETNNQINSDQWNLVWKSLQREFIERFIMVNSNMKNIILVAKNQRKVRSREAKKAQPQFYLVKTYMDDELSEIFKEIMDDEYLSEIPMLTLNTTIPIIYDLIDFIQYMDADGSKSLNSYGGIYTKEIVHFYLEKTKSYFDLMYRGHVQLYSQLDYALTDLLNILNIYTDRPVNDLSSSEPRSLRDYLKDVIKKFIVVIQELKITMEKLQDVTDAYIKNLPIYEMFFDQIEKLKTYPYKDKAWEEIHKNLLDLENAAPTKDFASFINALDKYIDAVIHDKPVDQKDLINLRNKTLIVAKTFIFDFADYVSYDRGMSIYISLRKVNNIGKTILYIVAPNSFQFPSDDQSSFLDYRFLYKRYLNPSNLLPPFKAQGVIVGSNNIITFNGKSYTIMSNSGSYILAKDYVNNKFEVLANYDDNVLSSISVSTDNGNTYELLSGGMITVNGENVALPFINENVTAWKDVFLFGIKAAVGIKIQCTMSLDIVQIFINGFYFGRVHGLLGSMNQEPTFDYNLPNGEKSTDMVSFVMAYSTTGKTIPIVITPVQTDQKPCPNLFSGVSSLKPIFETIPPMSYRATCNQIVSTSTSQQDSLDKACLVAKAYVSMAKENYVPSSSIPDICITTSVNDQTVNTRSTIEISTPSDVADVMILIEEVAKDQQALLNLLKILMDRLVKNFNYKQIQDVNFIVVGYSENSGDSNVHIYTANKDSDYQDILNNMPNWSSLLPPPPSSSSLSAQIPEDLYAHLKYAENTRIVQSFKKVVGQNAKDKAFTLSANYPYRANAIKTVVSIEQSLYDLSSPDVSVYTFNYIASAYAELGIKFNLVAPINLAYLSDTEIFGASGLNIIYTMSAPKGKVIDDEYTYDKSLETNLVLKTNGAMYNSQFFADGTGNQQNYFLRSLSRTIVYDAVKNSGVVKSCSASVHNGVMPYAVCTTVA